ncbi:O-methyltransferase [Gluconacetobacter diazotrophicus]|uniref:hypothetical protein n=2 Tax=Gluconacetobacter diazotrophicus TaxID=33996 RepID=UPI0011A1D721|nr:hypothetical protein [Gluconacetobacter diazotrophicus]
MDRGKKAKITMGNGEILSEDEKNQLVHGKIALSILGALSGTDGNILANHILQTPSSVKDILYKISTGTPVEMLRKEAASHTSDEGGRIEADFNYVGLPDEASHVSFETGFQEFMRPRLGARQKGFSVLFEHLSRHDRPFILETGCLRIPNNWEGDGQSTFQFDWYARENSGTVITIDLNRESIESARRACSNVTNTILNDSVSALNALSSLTSSPASLIYLDSFDLDPNNPMPSAIHHAKEMMAARHLIGPGTLICVDDFQVGPLDGGGKGLIIDQFMDTIRAKVLYSGYQKIWQIAS